MSHYQTIICPFYETHTMQKAPWKSTITCQNIKNNMGFDMRNCIKFENEQELKDYIEIFCADQNYKECEYFKSIYKNMEEK